MQSKTFTGRNGPYLTVFSLLRLGRVSVCVHHFHRGDEDRDASRKAAQAVKPTVNPAFKEFRKDGWPYCPNCEEDELYSHLMLGWTQDEPPPLQDCIDSGMKCYSCGWESLGRNVFGGRCVRCHQFFPRPEGEKDYIYCPTCQPLIQREVARAEVEAMEWPDVIG